MFNLTNQLVFSFRFINPLDFSFQVPLPSLWLTVPRGCNKERRMASKLFCSHAVLISLCPSYQFSNKFKEKILVRWHQLPEKNVTILEKDFGANTFLPNCKNLTDRIAFWNLRYFGDITQRIVVILYQCFGTTYLFHLQGPRVKKGRFLTIEGRTDRLSRNVGKKLQLLAAY